MKSLVEVIRESQAINEMAFSIGAFKEKIQGTSISLISHICLLFYSKLYLDGNYYKHWLGEARTFALGITKYELKSGNIIRAIRQTWTEKKYNTKEGVLEECEGKFNKEQIDKETQSILSELFASHFDNFIDDVLKDINATNASNRIDNFVFNIVKNSDEFN